MKSPELKQDKPFGLRLNEDFLAIVDDWRGKRRPLTGRSEAMRQMIYIAAALDKTESPPAEIAAPVTEARTTAKTKPKARKARKPLTGPTPVFGKARPYLRSLIADSAGWDAYRKEHGIKLEDLSSKDQCLSVCDALAIDVRNVFLR